VSSETLQAKTPKTALDSIVVKVNQGEKSESYTVYYIDEKVGTGAMPLLNQTIVANCVGQLQDSSIFWSTLDPKFGPVQPLESPLTRLIKGWQEGLLTMRVGGKRKLIIPYQLAYGEQG